MRNVVIDQKGSRLSHQRQMLVIHHDSFRRPIQLPLSQIQSLIITTQLSLDSHLLTKLSKHNIAVCILPRSQTGSACFLQGQWHAGVKRRQWQHELANNQEQVSYWASVLVRLKIHRQSQLLQRLLATEPSTLTPENQHSVNTAISQLQASKLKLKNHMATGERPDTATLRGIEGSASAIFFSQYQQFFETKYAFAGRNRRPPKDPVNAVLSLSYTLLQAIFEQAVFAVGFDPYLGILHDISYGRASLACDFVELKRADIEFWVWQLFHQQVLTLSDFNFDGLTDNTDQLSCELLKAGRGRFYEAFAYIKPTLKRDALKQVWLWQKRLEKANQSPNSPNLSNQPDDDLLHFMSEGNSST